MEIQLLYFDDCPSWKSGLKNLEAALQAEGISASVETVRVADDAEAGRLKFLGSPSFRVDGRDLWPEQREQYSLSCRVYSAPGGLVGCPSVTMLRAALQPFKPKSTAARGRQ